MGVHCKGYLVIYGMQGLIKVEFFIEILELGVGFLFLSHLGADDVEPEKEKQKPIAVAAS